MKRRPGCAENAALFVFNEEEGFHGYRIVTQLERMMKTARASIVIGALVSVLCLAGLTNCLAATVALQWDAVTDSDLAGYKVYYQANSSSAPFKGSQSMSKTRHLQTSAIWIRTMRTTLQ